VSEGFERIELGPGLVEIRGHGASLPAVFTQAALGVLSVVAAPAVPGAEDRREVRAHGRSLDDLLAAWIGECLYVHEIEGWVPERIEFASFVTAAAPGGETLRLHAFVHGGEAAPGAPGTASPFAVVRQASVRPTGDGFDAAVVLEARPAKP
jgi:Archease protein family (MTH1598/TM1083)